MHKRLYKEIKNDNNVELINEKVDIFFHGNVLKRYLTFPIWSERELFVKVYNNFKKHFDRDCIYKIAAIHRHSRAFFASVLFLTNTHQKYMLSFLYSHDRNIEEQKNLLFSFLSEHTPLEVSSVNINHEYLPKPVEGIVNDLLSHRVDRNLLRLRKVIKENIEEDTISFHEIQYLMDEESGKGISVLAGFQY